ncbi:MAG: LysR family transcriptional regulator [Nocardioides sp.]|nr:LysR family transcriptional regulator [Nocardioides sp.]
MTTADPAPDAPGLDPRRVLVFREVARAGSLSGAARTLGWTQPAVSQHLARLERDAGTALVLRGPAGVTLTEAGRGLLARADAVAAELRAAAGELAALAEARTGTVRLVAFPSAAATLVPDALAALHAERPEVRVGLEEAEPPEAVAQVLADDADLALVFGYDGPPDGLGPLAFTALYDEPVRLVVGPGAGAVRLADLADADWVGGCPRCRGHLVACCEAAGFTPRVQHSTDDYVVVQNLVARGVGVTVLPETALRAYRHDGVRVLEEPALGRRRVGLAYRPGAETVPATAALVAHLRRAASTI